MTASADTKILNLYFQPGRPILKLEPQEFFHEIFFPAKHEHVPPYWRSQGARVFLKKSPDFFQEEFVVAIRW